MGKQSYEIRIFDNENEILSDRAHMFYCQIKAISIGFISHKIIHKLKVFTKWKPSQINQCLDELEKHGFITKHVPGDASDQAYVNKINRRIDQKPSHKAQSFKTFQASLALMSDARAYNNVLYRQRTEKKLVLDDILTTESQGWIVTSNKQLFKIITDKDKNSHRNFTFFKVYKSQILAITELRNFKTFINSQRVKTFIKKKNVVHTTIIKNNSLYDETDKIHEGLCLRGAVKHKNYITYHKRVKKQMLDIFGHCNQDGSAALFGGHDARNVEVYNNDMALKNMSSRLNISVPTLVYLIDQLIKTKQIQKTKFEFILLHKNVSYRMFECIKESTPGVFYWRGNIYLQCANQYVVIDKDYDVNNMCYKQALIKHIAGNNCPMYQTFISGSNRHVHMDFKHRKYKKQKPYRVVSRKYKHSTIKRNGKEIVCPRGGYMGLTSREWLAATMKWSSQFS